MLSSEPWPFISKHHTTEPSHSFVLSLTVSSAQQDLWFNLTEWCPGPPRLGLRLWRFSRKSRAEGMGMWINAATEGGGGAPIIPLHCAKMQFTYSARAYPFHWGDRSLLAGTNMHKYRRCTCSIDWNWFWKQGDITARMNLFPNVWRLFEGKIRPNDKNRKCQNAARQSSFEARYTSFLFQFYLKRKVTWKIYREGFYIKQSTLKHKRQDTIYLWQRPLLK